MDTKPLEPWIIEEIKKKEEREKREREKLPELEIQIPEFPEDKIPSEIDNGYHEPGKGIIRKPNDTPKDRGVEEVPLNDGEEGDGEIKPFNIDIQINPEVGDGSDIIQINPDLGGNVTEGNVVEKKGNR